MIDDDRLRDGLDSRADGARIRLGDRARAVAVAHPRAAAMTRWRIGAWGRSLAVGLSALVVVVLVAGAFSLRSSTPDPAAGPSTSPEPATSGSPPTTPGPTIAPIAPIEPWGSLTWFAGDAARFEDTGANTYVQSAVWWRDRWFAVGYRFDLASKHVSGHVWTSPDGLSWSRSDSWPDVQFDRIVATADRLTIVGAHRQADVGDTQGPTRASMWISTDGADWTEAPFPAHDSEYWVVSSAAVGGHGWLVRTFDIDGRERWLAGDPVDGWRDVAVDLDAFGGDQVRDVVGAADGWVAFGTSGVDPEGPFGDPSKERAAIWGSDDGERWTAATIDQPGTSIDSVVRVANGWLATGIDHGGCPRCVGHPRLMWRSNDGRHWSPVDLDQATFNQFGGSFLASDGRRGLLFDTDPDARLRVRETVDGVDWTAVNLLLDQSMGSAGRLSAGIVAVGPKGLLTFIDPSTGPLDYFWMVPQFAHAGPPPEDAATQPPAPVSSSHDVACEPAPEPCGP